MANLATYFPVSDSTWIFFIVLLIILSAPMIMNRLRIPHLIGMVIAGIAVGQYGFNILERDASFELFGQVGLYFIMFLAGLEMDMEGFRKQAGRILGFGILTFAVPFLLVFAAGRHLMDYSRPATLLLCCVMASNTLIAYPIVCKYGLQRHKAVTLSVGASMFALLMALLSLSVIVGIYDKGAAAEGGSVVLAVVWMMVKLSLYVAGMVFFIPRATRWFLRHYSDGVTQFAFVLSVLFLSAALTDLIGLEGVLGAFFAGLVMNRYIPQVSPLMGRLEFTGNAVFIPYFLIGVGMLINVRALFEGWHTAYIVACIVVIGTLGKLLAGYAASFAFRLPWAHGNMMFGLTSAHAAGSIAIIMVGRRLEVSPGVYLVDAEMLNGVVMMILFTCIISSIVTESASRQIVLNELPAEEDDGKHGDDEKMLIPLSGEESCIPLVSLAILMRNKQLNRGIIGLNVTLDDEHVNEYQQRGRALLERAKKYAATADVRMQTQNRIATNIANGIMHAFKENQASEIVMGMYEPKTEKDGFWGVFTENLFTELNRQIIIARIRQPINTIRRIQVAVPSRAEFEPGFHRWMDRLARMAEQMDCRIVFHSKQATLQLITQYIQNVHPEVRAEYRLMAHWSEFPALAKAVNDDHLLVVVTARKSTVSYKHAFEKLPAEIKQNHGLRNLMIVFPDQYGEPVNAMTFAAPQKKEQQSVYSQIREWLIGIKARFAVRR